MLLVISAPSGAGKTTIVKNILENNSDLKFSVSATTRPMRSNEVDGRDYYFLSKEKFELKISNNELIEFEKLYNDNYYGTLKSVIDDSLLNNENLIFDIDVNGGLKIKKIYGKDAVTIFIMPPDLDTLIHRLKNRNTEDELQIQERISRVEMEMGRANEFDHIIINDDLETAVKKVQEIYNKFKK